MDYLLVTSGIALIIYALWRDRLKDDQQKKELDKYRQLQRELADAKKEVDVLLQQLESASERIVEEVSFGLEEIQSTAEGWIDKMSQCKSETLTQDTCVNENTDEVNKEVDRNIKLTTNAPANFTSKGQKGKNVSSNTVVFPTVKNNENKQKSSSETKQPYQEQMTPKHQMVCSMAKMGYSEEEIAKQMSIGKGEVRLILKLKRKGEEANA